MKLISYLLLFLIFGCNTSDKNALDPKKQVTNSSEHIKRQTKRDSSSISFDGKVIWKPDSISSTLFSILPKHHESKQYIYAHSLNLPDSMVDFSSAYVPIKLNFNGDDFDDYLLVKEVNMSFAEGILIDGKDGSVFSEASSFKTFDPETYGQQPMFWHRGIDSKFKVIDIDSTDGQDDLAVMYRMNANGNEAHTLQIFSWNKLSNICDLIFEHNVLSVQYKVGLDTDAMQNEVREEYCFDVLASESIGFDTISIYTSKSHKLIDQFPGIKWEGHDLQPIKTFVYDNEKRVYKQL